MSLQNTPASERVHIAFFGRRNAGKSSLINAVTGQELSVVSDVKGTTTDPVYKTMELLPIGPVVIIDTPGYDDEGDLGELRVKKTRQVLNKTDVAVLVVDGSVGMSDVDFQMEQLFKDKEIPYVIRERRPGDIATCYADATKAKEELGWEAKRDLLEMCEDSWRWQSNNPNGYAE